jgi:hypothetical protein
MVLFLTNLLCKKLSTQLSLSVGLFEIKSFRLLLRKGEFCAFTKYKSRENKRQQEPLRYE